MDKPVTTMEDLLGDFCLTSGSEANSLKERHAVTIWLPAEAKARYDLLQEKSERRFSKKAREVLIQLITLAESRIQD